MGVVLGLIAVSFAIWGIGDIFRGFGQSTVAKIGSTEITVDQFRQLYNDRLQQLGRQLGRPITPDQARALRLDQQLAGQLVAEAALDERARQLRLNSPTPRSRARSRTDPTFRGPTGQFDRARFEQMIRQAGYTEPRFAAEQKRLTLRRELADTVDGELTHAEDASNRRSTAIRTSSARSTTSRSTRARRATSPPPTPEVICADITRSTRRCSARPNTASSWCWR